MIFHIFRAIFTYIFHIIPDNKAKISHFPCFSSQAEPKGLQNLFYPIHI